MSLAQKQRIFTQLVARLIWELRDKGYDITFGEAWRPSETAAAYAAQGKGISNSLHTSRLAIDLNLFKDGKFLTRCAEYAEAGRVWESYATPEYQTCWGGHFGDGDHFSITHGGVK